MTRETNSPRDHPDRVHTIKSDYYDIRYLGDGTADVYLFPEGRIYDIGDGMHEYDVTALVVSGVVVWPDMEASIRMNYAAWCASGESLDL